MSVSIKQNEIHSVDCIYSFYSDVFRRNESILSDAIHHRDVHNDTIASSLSQCQRRETSFKRPSRQRHFICWKYCKSV